MQVLCSGFVSVNGVFSVGTVIYILVLLYVSYFSLMENSSTVEGVIRTCKQCGEVPLVSRIMFDEKAGKYETLLSCLYHKPHMLPQKCVADMMFTGDFLLVRLTAVVRCVYMCECVHVAPKACVKICRMG